MKTVLATMLALCLTDACANSFSSARAPTGAEICQHLNAVGCPQPDYCPSIVDAYRNTVNFHVDCLMRAMSTEEAIKCGSVTCRGVR